MNLNWITQILRITLKWLDNFEKWREKLIPIVNLKNYLLGDQLTDAWN